MSDIDKDLDNLAINDDDITARHRRERKELQAKVQALKKTASKGDKKKKKEVLEEIARLECDLNLKHDDELAELSKKETNSPIVENANENDTESQENVDDEGTARVSRAQKRRDKKAAEEKTRLAEVLAQDELNKTGPRIMESKAINKLLLQRGLMVQPISSDGKFINNAA